MVIPTDFTKKKTNIKIKSHVSNSSRQKNLQWLEHFLQKKTSFPFLLTNCFILIISFNVDIWSEFK